MEADGFKTLVTAEGYPVLDTNGNPIRIPGDVSTTRLSVSDEGAFGYLDPQGNFVDLNASFGIYQFSNPSGLEKLSNSLLQVTDVSGAAISEDTNPYPGTLPSMSLP